jgi:hypothetical protein
VGTEILKSLLVVFGCGMAAAGRGNDDMSIACQESFEDLDANVSETFVNARGKQIFLERRCAWPT